ncbi:HTH domain-containing protein [Paenibacillus larvae]|nr:HTH domain-containing protein [Paenibacillus larvae]MDT2275020.1 HTH domain-containing protein [Paenibacillus larvae]
MMWMYGLKFQEGYTSCLKKRQILFPFGSSPARSGGLRWKNERKTKTFAHFFLTKESKFISIKELASNMNCSEKTIRNDFKVLDNWLIKRSQAVLIRKPSAGVCLQAEDFRKNSCCWN